MTPSTTTQRVFIWAGPVMMVLWLGGWLGFAGLIPPPSPGDTAEEIARFYRDNPDGIRIGLILSVFGSTFVAPFVTVITLQLRRAEGRDCPWTVLQFVLGAVLVLAFITPLFFLLNAAFRVDRPAAEIQAFNDMGWTMFMGFVSSAVMELIAIGFAILKDKRADPVFPRWVGYFNIWCALMFCPGTANFFFFEGPLAWDGLFVWWVPLTAFSFWIVVMTAVLHRAIQHQEREETEDALGSVLAIDGSRRIDIDALAAQVAEHLARRAQDDEPLGAPGAADGADRTPRTAPV